MEVEEFEKKIDKIKEDAVKNILSHFNRINDKLFTFNNILIGGYFAISRIYDDINIKIIMIPLINLIFLIFLEYLMMEKSRKEASVDELGLDEFIKFAENKETRPTLFSSLAIISTSSVFGYFVYLLIF
ncbi:hypothetical protein [Maribacter sp. MAR_2009_72]|uniref:hypothetical protein n=1 Tax=Maribacter sp. MAR_2009_72 TaxID=1250050 RepID=UPI0011991F15|nr:hypothetical protein [Maribacter sp. MAR_2009_72]TVZ15602.1 hypothetical protein JM81_1849 [Maribacter sp. MAR_2009_72]